MDSRSLDTPVSPQNARAKLSKAKFSRALVLVLAVFSALSCFAGGVELVVWHGGNHFLPPLDTLRFTPFHDYFVPGVLLTLVVGGSQLFCTLAAYQQWKSAPLACVFAGGTLSVWIIAEAAMLRVFHPLHGVYLAVGLALLGLGVRAAWKLREPSARWILLVTAGELLGFAVPAATGILLNEWAASEAVQVVALGVAGACEGALLGAAQAWAWPLPVRKLRYALLTALAAGTVWVCAMLLVQLVAADDVANGVVSACAASTVLLGLTSIGLAQWLELRHHARGAWRFIAWTALAWCLALPFTFAPSPFVDEATPFAPQLALWTMGGLLMAVVMALVTWLGVRQLTRASNTPSSRVRFTQLAAAQTKELNAGSTPV